jgi:hypothetical protein
LAGEKTDTDKQMTKPHPITPTPELLEQWEAETAHTTKDETWHVAVQAARWGADQELEACVNYVDNTISGNKARALRAARRPKPPSLKEKALRAYWRFQNNEHTNADEMMRDFRMIEKALEALPDD